MSYTTGSVLVRFRGYLQAINQTWSIGLRAPATVPIAPADIQGLASAIATGTAADAAQLATATLGIGNAWTGVDVYLYNSLPGSSVATGHQDYASAKVGSGDNMPSDVALVVSLRSQFAGARNRGRIYLPCTKVSALEQNGQFGSNALTALVPNVKALINHTNTALATVTGVGAVSVISATHNQAAAITRFVIDSKLDTQRRREDKIPPAYIQQSAV